jgi:hypothetical protein
MNPPRQPHLKSDTLTSTAVRIQVNAQGDHHDLLGCADRKASYPREQIVGDQVVLGWADVFSRRGDLAQRPKRGSMSGGPITAGCASAQVGLGGDQERRGSHP